MTGLLIARSLSTIAVGAYLRLARSRRRKAARRAVWGVREAAIAEVRDGQMVRITGRAVARGPLRLSPISRRACIGFSLIVDRHDTGSPSEERVVDRDEFDSFAIADATGLAILHGPFDVKLDPYDKRAADLPPAFFEVLEREGVPVRSLLGIQHEFRYVETVLFPGDEIVAIGRASIELDPAGRSASRRDPPALCHLKGREEAVIITELEVPPV